MAELTPPPHAEITSSGHIWIDEDGIIIAVGSNHQLHTLEHAIENTRVNAKLAAGIRRPFMIDMNKVKSMSREAREYYAGPEPEKIMTAMAILTTSAVGKVVANFFLMLTKPPIPTRMFTNFDEARTWLLQHKQP